MRSVILSLWLAFLVTSLIIPPLLRLLIQKGMVDVPDYRKTHRYGIPTLGGIAIFLGCVISWLFLLPSTLFTHVRWWLLSILTVLGTGITDDLIPMLPIRKFLGQLLAVLALLPLLITLEGDAAGKDFHLLACSLLVKLFFLLALMNGYNFVDGANGLAGSLGVMGSTFLGAWFYVGGQEAMAIASFSLAGALLAFLRYNLSPAQLFMGDSGSLFIGLVHGILFLYFIKFSARNVGETYQLTGWHTFVVGWTLFFIPLGDLVRVVFLRLRAGSSPLRADRQHLHLVLLDRGWTHNSVLIFLTTSNILVVLLGIYFQFAGREGWFAAILLPLLWATLFLFVPAILQHLGSRQELSTWRGIRKNENQCK